MNQTESKEAEPCIRNADPGKKGKRGRPKKTLPESRIEPRMIKEAVSWIKGIAKEYSKGDLQSDIEYIKSIRPRLIRNAGIEEDSYDSTGVIRYDLQRVERMPAEDQKVIRNYLSSKRKIYFLRHSVAGIPEARLRQTAYDTLLRGVSCSRLAEMYGISERAVYKRKKKALEYMALKLLENRDEVFFGSV